MLESALFLRLDVFIGDDEQDGSPRLDDIELSISLEPSSGAKLLLCSKLLDDQKQESNWGKPQLSQIHVQDELPRI